MHSLDAYGSNFKMFLIERKFKASIKKGLGRNKKEIADMSTLYFNKKKDVKL